MSFLNMFLPLNRNTSLDVILQPEIRVSKVPAWTLWILIFEITVPYFFGGIAKINYDWLAGEPMRMRLFDRVPKGHFLAEWWAPYFFSYGGLFYDLFVAPMLMMKKTRIIAVASTMFFHASNYKMFNIGIFPWFMLFSTPLYFPEVTTFIYQAEWLFFQRPVKTEKALTTDPNRRLLVKRCIGLFVAFNCLMPFRHHLYSGHTDWTEAGHMYSWHMKLRRKTGAAKFTIKYADGTEAVVNNRDYLSSRQDERMNKRPASVLQFAHFLCQKAELASGGPVEVYVENPVVLNGRRAQNCVDPTVDLCKEELTWKPHTWILPLEIPLWDSSVSVLMKRVEKRDGQVFVGTNAIKKKTDQKGKNPFLFGKVTAYDRKADKWTVRLDDDGEKLTFTVKDLAKSHRYLARHEHGVLLGTTTSGAKDEGKSEL
jgi:vitamin K-dependent gamma-carboxylase